MCRRRLVAFHSTQANIIESFQAILKFHLSTPPSGPPTLGWCEMRAFRVKREVRRTPCQGAGAMFCFVRRRFHSPSRQYYNLLGEKLLQEGPAPVTMAWPALAVLPRFSGIAPPRRSFSEVCHRIFETTASPFPHVDVSSATCTKTHPSTVDA